MQQRGAYVLGPQIRYECGERTRQPTSDREAEKRGLSRTEPQASVSRSRLLKYYRLARTSDSHSVDRF